MIHRCLCVCVNELWNSTKNFMTLRSTLTQNVVIIGLGTLDSSWRPPEPGPELISIAAWTQSLTRRHNKKLTIKRV